MWGQHLQVAEHEPKSVSHSPKERPKKRRPKKLRPKKRRLKDRLRKKCRPPHAQHAHNAHNPHVGQSEDEVKDDFANYL